MEKQLLDIDLTKQSEILQVVPNPPLLTSEKNYWEDLLVQYHRQPAWEMPESSLAHNVIVIHNDTRSTPVSRKIDSTCQQETLSCGSCIIIPATAIHRSITIQETEFILLILEPNCLTKIAHETIDSDRVELIPQFAKLDPVISTIGFTLKAELEADGVGGRLYVESATAFLAAHLLRHYCARTQSLAEYTGGLPKYKLRQAIAYIQEHLGEEISLEAIATHLNMSQYYFCHLFKQSMGVSPYQYVLQQRINKAKQLLKQRQLTITNVALECGFANQTHFTKHFRKLTGVTPKVYREQ